MKVIIAGSRSLADMPNPMDIVNDAIVIARYEHRIIIGKVICGEAKGADLLGRRWAQEREIPVLSKPADWRTHGKRAGVLRNEEMAQEADALIAIWDGKSRGTQDMIRRAKKRRIPVYVHHYELPEQAEQQEHQEPQGVLRMNCEAEAQTLARWLKDHEDED